MSRTYRKGEGKRNRREERTEGFWSGDGVDYTRRSEQPERITAEWALNRMADAISFAVQSLVDGEIIAEDDREDCAQELRIRVARAAERYDRERMGTGGRKASAVHFLTVVIDNGRKNLIRAFAKYGAVGEEVPLGAGGGTGGDGGGSGEETALSDGCRSVRELEWEIDMEIIRSMLTRRQHTAFEMLLEGRTREETQSEIGVFGGSFYRKILEPIREVVKACGYGPGA